MKKRSRILIYPLIFMGLLLVLTNSCKKADNADDPNADNNNNETISDVDGNVYHTVTIGTQVWMVENLKVTKYRNGDAIPNITDNTQWGNLTTGAYCSYDNSAANTNIYGCLYNWYAVNDSRNIAPMGWHVPDDNELLTLTSFLGGINDAGGKLKEIGTAHWNSPNTGATDQFGYKALPGGSRSNNGTFNNIGNHGFWWCTSELATFTAWSRSIYADAMSVSRYSIDKLEGLSVRCIKD